MYPWYQGMQNGFDYELPEDDRLGIQSLYGAHEDAQWGRKNNYYPPYLPPPTPRTQSTPPTTTTRASERPRYPQYPNYPGYPQDPQKPRYPNLPHNPKKPHYPEKPYYPGKPMNPEKKKNYYPYPNYPDKANTPQYPDLPRRYPQRPSYPETTTYPEKNPDWPPRRPKESAAPDTCDTSYDAISVIRREVFIFKDRYFWRIGDSGLLPGYPAEITRMWRDLPKNLTHIDAVYERPDNKIVFFIGKLYYVYSGNNIERGYPQPLTALGLPGSLESIDGAMVWGHNGKTYFYSGNMYWRFDEDLRQVELDYPRDMSMWRGVGTDVDAVFQWKDGKTYFFKGKGFWKFNDLRMRVENEQQTLSAPFWMGCSRNLQGTQGSKAPYKALPASSSSSLMPTIILLLLSALKLYVT